MKTIQTTVKRGDKSTKVNLTEYETLDEAIAALGIEKVLKHVNYVIQLIQRSGAYQRIG